MFGPHGGEQPIKRDIDSAKSLCFVTDGIFAFRLEPSSTTGYSEEGVFYVILMRLFFFLS